MQNNTQASPVVSPSGPSIPVEQEDSGPPELSVRIRMNFENDPDPELYPDGNFPADEILEHVEPKELGDEEKKVPDSACPDVKRDFRQASENESQNSDSSTTQSDSGISSKANGSLEASDPKQAIVDAGSTSCDNGSPKQTDKNQECENRTTSGSENKDASDPQKAIVDAGSISSDNGSLKRTNEVLESEETATKVIKTINYSDYSSSQRTMNLKEWETFLKKLPDEIKYIYHYTTRIAADSIVRQGVIHARQPIIGWTGSGVFMTKLDPSSGKEGILNNNYNTSNGWCDYRAQAAIAIRLDQISPEEVHGWFETKNPQAAKDRWRNNESINLEKLEYYVIHTGW